MYVRIRNEKEQTLQEVNLGSILEEGDGISFLRYAGKLLGEEIYEGDYVETSDGHLGKKIEWVERDYGFGSLYHIARYVEKVGCQIKVTKPNFIKESSL